MNFVSIQFVLLFVVTWLAFVALPPRQRKWLLLVASYLFYATWSLPFIGVILLTTTTDYWMSRIIAKSPVAATRKTALVSGLVLNLMILAIFKYCNFALDSGHGLAALCGVHWPLPTHFNILLPLGISFYTFEAISYMVDVYRAAKQSPDEIAKHVSPSWWDYNFYIMYFPHLISGPIVRFGELFPQYAKPIALPTMERMAKGVELCLLGYAFKVFLADPASTLVDPVFNDPTHASVVQTYLAALGFTVQIYFDFMGYTHIARGVSLLFNLEMPLNFNHPYLATNISDFWQRWHMSLSRWIRDYLYIPLGGSRAGKVKQITNLVVTMTLCGAWHGAGWTYILWGTYHGLLLAVFHTWRVIRRALGWTDETVQRLPAYPLVMGVATFALVIVGWMLFRAPNLTVAGQVIGQLARVGSLVRDLGADVAKGHLSDLMTMVLLVTVCVIGPTAVRALAALYRPLPFWAKSSVAWGLFWLCWVMTAKGTAPFIYFQF